MNRPEVAIAYRMYPGVSRNPFLHSDDKLALSRVCLRSFYRSIGTLPVKCWFILDGCPNAYRQLILEEASGHPFEMVSVDSVGNQATFRLQLEILSTQNEADVVYLAEDDYVYLPNMFRPMFELLKCSRMADFVTPYDHLDYYSRINLHEHRFRVESFAGLHWREAVYTCCTFMTTKRALQKTVSVLSSYALGNTDISMWMALTKFNVRNPYRFLKYLVRDREFLFPSLWRAYRFCLREVLFGRPWKLMAPIPSIATHAEQKFLAPNIDWGGLVQQMQDADSA